MPFSAFDDAKPRTTAIDTVVIHETAGLGNIETVTNTLRAKDLGVHYVAARNGKAFQLTSDDLVVSHTEGQRGNNINARSIGIEMPNVVFDADGRRAAQYTRDDALGMRDAITEEELANLRVEKAPGGTKFGTHIYLNPQEQCDALYSIVLHVIKKHKIPSTFPNYDAAAQTYKTGPVTRRETTQGGIFSHRTVPNTSHGDGIFGQLFVFLRLVGGLSSDAAWLAGKQIFIDEKYGVPFDVNKYVTPTSPRPEERRALNLRQLTRYEIRNGRLIFTELRDENRRRQSVEIPQFKYSLTALPRQGLFNFKTRKWS